MATDKGNKKSSDLVKKLGDDAVYVKMPLKTDQMDEETLQKLRDIIAEATDVTQSAKTSRGDVLEPATVAEADDVMKSISSSKGDVLEPAPSNDVETPAEQSMDPNESMETNEPPAPAAPAIEESPYSAKEEAMGKAAIAEAEAKNPSPPNPLVEGVKNLAGNLVGAAMESHAKERLANPDPTGAVKRPDLPGQPATSAAQPPPPVTGMSASVTTPGKRPSFGAPPVQKVQDYSVETRVALEEALNGQIAAERAKGQARGELAKEYLKQQAVDAEYAADTMTANSIRQERAEQFQKSQRDLLAEISRTDPTIDPNRYWHNKSGGQVALGAIAGALFGFAGKGIDYLGVIQREIDRDVQAQVDTFNNRGRLLDKAQNNINSTYEQARQDGLSDQEARAKAYTATTASLGAYLNYVTQMNAAAASNAEIVNIRSQLPLTLVQAMEKGQAAALAAGEKASSIYLNGANARATLRNAETNAQNAETARIKVGMEGGGSGKKVAPQALLKQIQGYRDLVTVLEEAKNLASAGDAKKLFRKTEGTIMAPGGSIPGVSEIDFPVVGSYASANAANRDAKTLNERIMRAATQAQLAANDERRLSGAELDINKIGSGQVKSLERQLSMTQKELKNLMDSAKDYDLSGVVMNSEERDPNFNPGDAE